MLIPPRPLPCMHAHAGEYIFLSMSCSEFYYTGALILLVRRICVVMFIARNERQMDFLGCTPTEAVWVQGYLVYKKTPPPPRTTIGP